MADIGLIIVHLNKKDLNPARGQSAIRLQEAKGLWCMRYSCMQFLRQLTPDVLGWSRAWLRISPREAVLLSPQCMAVLLQQDELSRFPGGDDDTIPSRRRASGHSAPSEKQAAPVR